MQHKSDNRSILEGFVEVDNHPQSRISLKQKQENDEEGAIFNILEEYLQSIKSFKKELTYFIGQNNRIFLNPVWAIRPPNNQGYWQVEGCLRYEINDSLFEYRFQGQGKSKKEGEEKVAKKIFLSVCSDFPRLFFKFKKIKQSRGFD